MFGVTKANPNIFYSFTFTGKVNNQTQREEVKFYKINLTNGSFEDRSANLPDLSGDGFINTQGSYNMVVAVKPDDENFVVIGATSLFRSTNGFESKPSNPKNDWIGGYSYDPSAAFFYPNLHPDIHIFYSIRLIRIKYGLDTTAA